MGLTHAHSEQAASMPRWFTEVVGLLRLHTPALTHRDSDTLGPSRPRVLFSVGWCRCSIPVITPHVSWSPWCWWSGPLVANQRAVPNHTELSEERCDISGAR